MLEKESMQTVLLGFTPLLEESDMSSQSHMELIEYVLSIFGKNLSNVICFIGDNCNMNKSFANLCGLPLVGCYAHRFNLAVNEYLSVHEILLSKVFFSSSSSSSSSFIPLLFLIIIIIIIIYYYGRFSFL